MKTKIRGDIFQLTKPVLFFSIIVFLSCTSTSVVRLEDKDFKENLPGLWEGKMYYASGRIGPERIKIIKIDGNKVHLTGYASGTADGTDEVSGRIENSTLILTWGAFGGVKCKDELRMIRDDSNNLILEGPIIDCPGFFGTVRLKKIE